MTKTGLFVWILVAFFGGLEPCAVAQTRDFHYEYAEIPAPTYLFNQTLIQTQTQKLKQLLENDPEFKSTVNELLSQASLPAFFKVTNLVFENPYDESYERRLKVLEAALFRADALNQEHHASLLCQVISFLQDRWVTMFFERLLNPSTQEANFYSSGVMLGLVGFLSGSLLVKNILGPRVPGANKVFFEHVGQATHVSYRRLVAMGFRKIFTPLDWLFQTHTTSRLVRMGGYMLVPTESNRGSINGFIKLNLARNKARKPFPAPLSIITMDSRFKTGTPISNRNYEDLRDAFVNPTTIVLSIAADRFVKRLFWYTFDPYITAIKFARSIGLYQSWWSFVPRLISRMPRGAQAIKSPFSIIGVISGATAAIGGSYLLREGWEAIIVSRMNSDITIRLKQLSELQTSTNYLEIFREAYKTFVLVSERARFTQTHLDNKYEEILQGYISDKVCVTYNFPTRRVNDVYHYLPDSEEGYRTLQKEWQRLDRDFETHIREIALAAAEQIPPASFGLNEYVRSMQMILNRPDIRANTDLHENLATIEAMAVTLQSTLSAMIVENYQGARQYQDTDFTLGAVEKSIKQILHIRNLGVTPIEQIPESLPQEVNERWSLSANYHKWKHQFDCLTPYEAYDLVIK